MADGNLSVRDSVDLGRIMHQLVTRLYPICRSITGDGVRETLRIIKEHILAAIAGRISEFGLSPNRVAALGENLILLVNLSWSAWIYFRFLRGRVAFAALEQWQTAYLPVYGVWAALVVAGFPPVFGFI